MKKEIEAAILSTLVVENKESIKYAVDKILEIIENSRLEELNEVMVAISKIE